MGLAKTERAMAAAGKGCLGKAADNEPVFILRGQDRLSASLVELWANLALEHGCDGAKVADAQNLAAAMRRWPTRKFPD